MSHSHCPPGYLSKADAARHLGVSTKTLDRRRAIEPMLKDHELRKGNQVYFPRRVVEQYFQMCQKRGRI